MRRAEKQEEISAAARVVAGALGANSWIDHDDQSRDGMVDVLIHREVNTVALEVTSSRNEAWERAGVALNRTAALRPLSPIGYHWVFSVESSYLADLDLCTLVDVVSEHESALHERVDAASGQGLHRDHLPEALTRLHVTLGFCFGPAEDPGGGVIHLAHGSSGTAEWPLERVAQLLFEKRDNQAKLKRQDADERHLWIYLHGFVAEALCRQVDGLEPCPPDPEDVIDSIWLCAVNESARTFRVTPGKNDWKFVNP